VARVRYVFAPTLPWLGAGDEEGSVFDFGRKIRDDCRTCDCEVVLRHRDVLREIE
jgi:hypothetical protein